MNSSIADSGELGGGPYRNALAQARGRFGRLASTVLFYPCVGSTNDIAASHVRESLDERQPGDPEGVVIVADAQTAGRGRRGHAWISPPGAGLYVSVVLMPSRAAANPQRATGLLTLAAGVAICEAIETVTALGSHLKWPNDVYVGRKKLAGILAEAVGGIAAPTAAVVVGYGINVLATDWPREVAQRATSIESEIGRAVDRAGLLVETLASLSRRYDDLLAARFDAILDAWRQHAPSACGTRVAWTDAAGEHSGITAGVDEDGALLLRVGEAARRIVAGELRWEL